MNSTKLSYVMSVIAIVVSLIALYGARQREANLIRPIPCLDQGRLEKLWKLETENEQLRDALMVATGLLLERSRGGK